jgi:hypothetical protein
VPLLVLLKLNDPSAQTADAPAAVADGYGSTAAGAAGTATLAGDGDGEEVGCGEGLWTAIEGEASTSSVETEGGA